MAKGRRVTIAPNIFRYEGSGKLEAAVSVKGRPRRVRPFPPEYPIPRIQTWVADTRKELEDEVRAFGELPAVDERLKVGTLTVDVAEFLLQKSVSASDRSHLRAWLPVIVSGETKPLGDLPRDAITPAHINKVIAHWLTKPSVHAVRRVRVSGYARKATQVNSFTIRGTTVQAHDRGGLQAGHIKAHTRKGSTIAAYTAPAATVTDYERAAPATSGSVVAARTIRHRVRVLTDLYHTLDGADAATPLDAVTLPKKPKTVPVTVAPEIVEAVLVNLAQLDPPTAARFGIACTTGQRPCQIARATAGDVNLAGGPTIWLVREAKGEPGHSIWLNPTQVLAWEYFAEVNAWGAFDTSKYGKLIHAAGWPKGIRPYAAKHSIGRHALNTGSPLSDLQGLYGHASPETTRIYAPFELAGEQRRISEALTPYLASAVKTLRRHGLRAVQD